MYIHNAFIYIFVYNASESARCHSAHLKSSELLAKGVFEELE